MTATAATKPKTRDSADVRQLEPLTGLSLMERCLKSVSPDHRLSKLVTRPPRELSFWGAATDQSLSQLDYPEYHGGRRHGQAVGLFIRRLGEGPAHVHLDIYTDDLDAEVKRLEHLGAQRVQHAHTWWVMRDPAGLLFCVIPEPGSTLNDSNARRWE